MTTAQDKVRQKADLAAKGYSIQYINSWQPKVDMWWHRDWLNLEGEVVKSAGTLVPNQPGNPDTQMRLSTRGLLPWKPGEDCLSRTATNGEKGCKGCRDRRDAQVFAPVTHPHKYRGRDIGAPCRVTDCTATRKQVPVKRKRAAVTMAEAAV